MDAEPSVILVAPYEGDRFESIERFVRCLERELSPILKLHVVQPRLRLARRARAETFPAKWLGYADKFLLFPRALRERSRGADLIHFSDQSCAIFARRGAPQKQLLTCTDLLAIRSARGEFAENRTGWSGRQLQRMILAGIARCGHVACISQSTARDLARLAPGQSRSVIPMGLHRRFQPLPSEQAWQAIPSLERRKPFILHVGGNQWYKNRRGVLRIYRALLARDANAPNLVLAGRPLTPELRREIGKPDLANKVFCAPGLDDEQLAAAYSAAELLLFPSLAEGFGWPIIEAQACGCRVATSEREPMSEIGGSAAELIDPESPEAAAARIALLLAESPAARNARVAGGQANAARFSTEAMVQSYAALYRGMVRAPKAIGQAA
jgi:glycosyltransferase involved in cell wall biosynthesis